MNVPLSPELATQVVIWGGLVIGLLLGAVTQVSRFCAMGALADWFTFGACARLMMWMLAVVVAATGALLLMEAGWLDASKTNAWSVRLLWLSNIVGGVLFGVGMVLASGCLQRNLVRLGAGSLKALVTLLVAGVTAQMTLRGVLSELRVGWLDAAGVTLNYPQDIGSLLAHVSGLSAGPLRQTTVGLCVAVCACVLFRSRRALDAQHWVGGAAIGLLVVAAWLLTGHIGYLPEDPQTLESVWSGTYSHRPEALTFAAPLAHSLDLLTLWTDRNNILTYGVVVCLGTVLGSAGAALWRKEFRLESFRDARDMGAHMVGAVLMGFGGVTAMGCSIGQGVSGLALLSAGAFLSVTGIAAGAWLALRYQAWRMG